MTADYLQLIRGTYERIVIDNAAPVPAFVENQSVVNLDALAEYCIIKFNFGPINELVIGGVPQRHIRASLICEIFTRKNIGPGRGLQIATPIKEALEALNGVRPTATQQIVPRIGRITGPNQSQLQDRPHHYTRLSCPVSASYRPLA
jgi:hypothetical protein